MAKRKESRYSPGRRSENRLKIKTRMQQEAIIGGVTGTKPPRSGIFLSAACSFCRGGLRIVMVLAQLFLRLNINQPGPEALNQSICKPLNNPAQLS